MFCIYVKFHKGGGCCGWLRNTFVLFFHFSKMSNAIGSQIINSIHSLSLFSVSDITEGNGGASWRWRCVWIMSHPKGLRPPMRVYNLLIKVYNKLKPCVLSVQILKSKQLSIYIVSCLNRVRKKIREKDFPKKGHVTSQQNFIVRERVRI